jgi:hypothetical protein
MREFERRKIPEDFGGRKEAPETIPSATLRNCANKGNGRSEPHGVTASVTYNKKKFAYSS